MSGGSKDQQAARLKPRFKGVDPFWAYLDPAGGRMEDQVRALKPQTRARSFIGSRSLSEFLCDFQLVVELNRWTEKEKGLYLRVSLDGSALKLLEKVDASMEGGFDHLVGTLEQCYQTADQIAHYQTQLWSMRQSPKEAFAEARAAALQGEAFTQA